MCVCIYVYILTNINSFRIDFPAFLPPGQALDVRIQAREILHMRPGRLVARCGEGGWIGHDRAGVDMGRHTNCHYIVIPVCTAQGGGGSFKIGNL